LRDGSGWMDIPLLKGVVDAVAYGRIGEQNGVYAISLIVEDYTGETVLQIDRGVTLRQLQPFLEDFTEELKKMFPFEGTVTSINKLVYINLGRRFGLKKEHKLYCFYNYFDDSKKAFAKKSIARLRIVDPGERISASMLESIAEGYLLEPGVKVKRYREPELEDELVQVTLLVSSKRGAVSDANVYVDQYWKGQTSGEGMLELSFQKNIDTSISIYKEGYLSKELLFKATEQAETVGVELEQGKTQLFLETVPQGALVYIDGEYQGTSPIIKKPLVVPYGFHLLELELGGYKRYRKYLNFNEKKIELTGESRVGLFMNLLEEAEQLYKEERIEDAIERLGFLSAEHPDYIKGLELLGYIYLHDIGDYEKAIEYYTRALGTEEELAAEPQNILTHYNLAQAYYNRAEKQFYTDVGLAQAYYINAVAYLNVVRQYKGWIPSQQRKNVYQNALFYLAVSYQKIYYLSGKEEFLQEARYGWMSYFDFFDEELLEEIRFKRQYSVAKTFSEEVQRLQSEK
jgi:tetratricopeptide (TPR) repeat protein